MSAATMAVTTDCEKAVRLVAWTDLKLVVVMAARMVDWMVEMMAERRVVYSAGNLADGTVAMRDVLVDDLVAMKVVSSAETMAASLVGEMAVTKADDWVESLVVKKVALLAVPTADQLADKKAAKTVVAWADLMVEQWVGRLGCWLEHALKQLSSHHYCHHHL